MAKRFQTYKRLNSPHAAGAKAIRVWVCRGCDVHHRQDHQPGNVKPPQCIACGRMDFDEFPSIGEATHWAQLRQLEKRGVITDLRRQTWHDLFAYGPQGQPVKVGAYVADFEFNRDGQHFVCDSKPAAGIDDLAALKLRLMDAMGKRVTIITNSTILRGD